MKYFKCRNCDFNITSENEHCPYCGVWHPVEPLAVKEVFDEKGFKDIVFGILTIVFSLFLIPGFVYGFPNGFLNACGAIIVLWLLVTIPFSIFITAIAKRIAKKKIVKNQSEINKRKKPYPESLSSKKILVWKRISELRKRESELEPILQKAKNISGEQRQQVIKTLEATIGILKKHQAHYVTKSIEIEIVRLQNNVAPIVYEADQCSYNQINSHLIKISKEQIKINELSGKLELQKGILGKAPEIEELSTRLFQTNDSLVKLNDALISRQAFLALQKVTPMSKTLSNVPPPIKALRESEVFNINVAITDFSMSLKELDFEYERIQQEDIAIEIEKILNNDNF